MLKKVLAICFVGLGLHATAWAATMLTGVEYTDALLGVTIGFVAAAYVDSNL